MLRKLTLAVALCLQALPLAAETGGNAAEGFAYASARCANCHSVLPMQTVSPVPGAPAFKAIADTRGMTETALAVWFRTPHPTMPNLIIQGEDMDNVIAYIVSLKSK